MFAHLWIIACLTIFSPHVECQDGAFNFPDDPQPTPEDASDVLPMGLEGIASRSFHRKEKTDLFIQKNSLGRQAAQATTLPTPATPAATTIAVTTNIVTPPVGQTCICVPTGSCNTTVPPSPGGEGLLDVRIVTNVSVSQILFAYTIYGHRNVKMRTKTVMCMALLEK